MQHDRLLQIFKSYLDEVDPETANVSDLIYNTVGDYMAHLMSKGNIPQHMLDQLEEDLKEEVIEIYRKITYGFLTLKDYRNSQRYKKRVPHN